jgi:hypothetical protein
VRGRDGKSLSAAAAGAPNTPREDASAKPARTERVFIRALAGRRKGERRSGASAVTKS